MVHHCTKCGHGTFDKNEGLMTSHYVCNDCGYVHHVNIFNLQVRQLRLVEENLELILYALIAVATPFFLNNQLLTGTIINSMLFLAALNLKTYKILPIIILPSTATVIAGTLFNINTTYLLWMIVPIWIANSMLVYVVKSLQLHLKKDKWMSALLAILIKASFLFIIAIILIITQGMPTAFIIAMGPMQIITGILGAGLAFGIQHGTRMLHK